MFGGMFEEDEDAGMMGGLFDQDFDESTERKELDTDLPPAPYLRREVSLSKNTMASLQDRLLDLEREELERTTQCNNAITRLQAEIEREKLKLAESKAKIQREVDAVKQAIDKCKTYQESLKKEGKLDDHLEETACGVCLEQPRDALVAPCGHIAMCYACSTAIAKSKNNECPFCRVRIIGVYKTFHV